MYASTVKIGGQWVEYVDEERLVMTDDPERAAFYRPESLAQVAELAARHKDLDVPQLWNPPPKS